MSARVCQVSFSQIDDDPRVLRAISAFEDEGYEVFPVGYGYGLEYSAMDMKEKLWIALRKLPAKILRGPGAELGYWLKGENRQLYKRILEIKPDIIHANDWNTLPAVAHAAKKLKVPFVYDSHEFGVGQGAHKKLWNLVYPAYIHQLEKRYIGAAAHVTTVSHGIATLLQQAYNLPVLPTILRSTPDFVEVQAGKTDASRILVQYHGIFTSGRGLENLIRSVPLWPENFQLRLTGRGRPDEYKTMLEQLAGELGVSDRVEFVPFVPHEQLVSHANEADIGMCFGEGNTDQLKHALPNKAFEYVMAGLMVVCGPGAELKRLVDDYGHGITLADNAPQTLAEAFKQLDAATIDAHKKKAITAAKDLCWENEKKKLTRIYRNLLK